MKSTNIYHKTDQQQHMVTNKAFAISALNNLKAANRTTAYHQNINQHEIYERAFQPNLQGVNQQGSSPYAKKVGFNTTRRSNVNLEYNSPNANVNVFKEIMRDTSIRTIHFQDNNNNKIMPDDAATRWLGNSNTQSVYNNNTNTNNVNSQEDFKNNGISSAQHVLINNINNINNSTRNVTQNSASRINVKSMNGASINLMAESCVIDKNGLSNSKLSQSQHSLLNATRSLQKLK